MDSDFFDENVNIYEAKKIYSYDIYFINFIEKQKNKRINLLDVGGGSGLFAEFVRKKLPNVNVTVIDPSKEMLDKIKDKNITKIQGKLPNQISLDAKFNYIHVKEVFHHITGSSIKESKDLLKQSLNILKDFLKNNGFLLIHEVFYESYMIPKLSRTIIFYLLAMQNNLGIKIPSSEFLMNLNTCFYTRSEFSTILNDCGFEIIDTYEDYWEETFKKKLLLLKSWGRMLYILRLKETDV